MAVQSNVGARWCPYHRPVGGTHEANPERLDNRYVILRNPGRGRRRGQRPARRLIIGRTDGGRALTLVVERTREPTTWLIVTGWEATARERKILDG